MGFFSKLFKKASEPILTSSPVNFPTVSEEDHQMMDFEDQYEKILTKLFDRATDAEPNNEDSTQKTIAAYEKAIRLFDELKKFCESKGPIGKLYFEKNYQQSKDLVISDYKTYMDEDYPEQKQYEDEEAEYKRYYKATEKKILHIISSGSGFLQKNIYALFPAEDKSLIVKIINDLVQNGKISKQKQGNSNLLRLVKEK